MVITEDLEQIAMELIGNSGDARSLAYGALQQAKSGNFNEATKQMNAAKEASRLAHQAQTELLAYEASGNSLGFSVLLVHAQDHLMTSMLAQELIAEIIELHKNKEDKREEN